MKRSEFRKLFRTTGPAVLPVIHVLDERQVAANIGLAMDHGAQGVFLINHDFGVDQFLPIIRAAREKFPSLWLGVNFLGVTGRDAFPVLANLDRQGCFVDAYWADDARIDETAEQESQAEAEQIARVRADGDWSGMYFGGTAFKKQRPVDPAHYGRAAGIAKQFMDVVTTSGVATGESADREKIMRFRGSMGDTPLALASGVTPENIGDYAAEVDAVLVATGVNRPGDFHNLDGDRLSRLVRICRRQRLGKPLVEVSNDRDHRWYLALMAPRSRSEKYAWLDPSSAYVNARAFHAMLDDLLMPFSAEEIDVVAGFDAAGFVLGAAMADRLGKGFLTIRKGGKVPVDYDVVDMNNYSGQTQQMEMRKPAFAPGTRVLLVDQWIETGGTMLAGISLVERQQGRVAGIAAVCIEDTEVSRDMYQSYKMASCVLPGSEIQGQCDRQSLDSFSDFRPESYFPKIDH